MRRSLILEKALPSCLLVAALASCGLGTAGIATTAGGSSGSGNSAPSLSQFRVESTREAPAEIRFSVSDRESDPATIEFCYEVQDPTDPTGMTVLRELMAEIGPNPATFVAPKGGMEHTVSWTFPGESNLDDDGRFETPVKVIAILPGGEQELVLGVGNDAPVVTLGMPPPAEVSGIVPLDFNASDSSGDLVTVDVEYDVVGDAAGWLPATPAGPFLPFEAPATGVDVRFFWDTDVDLVVQDVEVRVRYTADDGLLEGAPVETPTFRVDNNEEPIAFLDSGLLLANTDRRRGIPVPFEVFDAEGDPVDLVLQWRLPGEGFRTATELPVSIGGRVVPVVLPVVPVGADTTRLPELGSSAAGLLARGIVGGELEILRRSKLPVPVAASWPANPLQVPVAALALDGPLALVLDGGGGGWRLSRMDLGTGEVLQSVSSIGTPSAMAYEPDGQAVLVASDTTGTWQLERVDLATMTVTALVSAADGLTERGTIRGVASLGHEAAVITVASSLIHVSYPIAGLPGAVSLLVGLHTPWGVVPDPLNANRVYLAERDAPTPSGTGRVVALRLDTRAQEAVGGLARPSSVAIQVLPPRLLVVTDANPADAEQELSAVDLGGGRGAQPSVIVALAAGEIGGVAAGPAGLLLVALTSGNDLAVGGGVEQVRTIESYDPAGQEVRVDRPFQPPLAPLTPWRFSGSGRSFAASPGGTRGSFVWDSSDLEGAGGEVFFRVEPFDSEEGLGSESALSKDVLHPFEQPGLPVALGGEGVTDGPDAGLVVDLDGDGTPDLVSANRDGDDLTVFFQPAGGFRTGTPPDLVLGDADTTNAPTSLAAGDLDDDGDLDLVSASSGSHRLTLFFQSSPGVFDPTPTILGGSATMNRPSSVQAADLNGDGLLDLVAANAGYSDLTVFFQVSAGVFDPTPAILGSVSTTNRPSAVVAADLDGDGDLDLVSANRQSEGPHARNPAHDDLQAVAVPGSSFGNNLAVFFQTGPGVFDPLPTLLGDESTTNRPNAVAAADLDGDGDLDLVSANQGPRITGTQSSDVLAHGSNLTLFFQTSAGVFDPVPLVLGKDAVTADPSDVVAVDLDGDGDLDLAASIQKLDNGGGPGDNLALYHQVSPGVFRSDPPVRVGDIDTSGSPAAIAAADVNGDGSPDLVSFNSNEFPTNSQVPGRGNDVTIFLQSRAGRPDRTLTTLGFLNLTAVDVEVADIDGDGDLDVLAAECANFPTDPVLFTQSAPATFLPGVDLPGDGGNPLAVLFPTNLVVTDLDGDADLDVALAAYDVTGAPVLPTEAGVRLLFQTSLDVFTRQDTLLFPQGASNIFSVTPTGLAAADLDGDGDPDLAATNWAGARLALFFQRGPDPGVYPGVFDPTPLSVEHDGWFVVDEFPGRGSRGPCSVVAADLDGDGYRDLATVNQVLNDDISDQFGGIHVGGDVTIFFQTSPGAFEEDALVLGDSPTLGVTLNEAVIDAADMDGDGDLDLISPSGVGQDVTIFYQTGHRAFDPTPTSLPSVLPFSVQAGDVDRDGDLDLVAANLSTLEGFDFTPGDLALFRQTSRGTFTAESIAPDGMGNPLKVKIADVDGDGEADLVVGSFTGEVTVLYGGHE